MSTPRRSRWGAVPLIVLAFLESSSAESLDPKRSSIEELLETEITSVSSTSESVKRAAAAVFVLTSDDIRRSGATSIPALLRYVPGVNVARVDANKWALSIRGFNTRAANKLLVLVDGRSIYDPLFSGVLWELQDIVLENIERIEVIRGPGGSIWGANAVNGVINIITKKVDPTQGEALSVGGGDEERAFGTVQYSNALSPSTSYRAYARYYDRGAGYRAEGSNDESRRGEVGFRVDSDVSNTERFTLQGSVFDGTFYSPSPGLREEATGAHIHGEYQNLLSPDSDLTVRSYYFRQDLEAPELGQQRDIAEVAIQHHLPFLRKGELVYGAGYRVTSDSIDDGPFLSLDPPERTDHLFNIFFDHRSYLLRENLILSLGARIEHNDYTGLEVQPSTSLSWSVTQNTTLWASIGRAVRTPSRLEADFVATIPSGRVTGSREVQAESLMAYEVGMRSMLSDRVLLDISSFFNDYHKLLTFDGITIDNDAKGQMTGIEVATSWTVQPWWRLRGAYSFIHADLDLYSNSSASRSVVDEFEGNVPSHTATLWSSTDFGERVSLDLGIRYVDNLKTGSVDSYVAGDIRVGWRATKDLELSLAIQNLFDPRRSEFGGTNSSQAEQRTYGRVSWKF